MSDTLTIVGTCTEISEKNGWHAFHIDVGSQYPVKLSTKKDTVIAAGRAAGAQTATWTYKESQGGENPNRPGTFYTNRYLESVEVGEAGLTTIAPNVQAARPVAQAVPEASHAALRGGDKDRAITRMSCLKSAAETLAGTFDVNTDDPALEVMKAASRFEQWVYRDLSDDLPFG